MKETKADITIIAKTPIDPSRKTQVINYQYDEKTSMEEVLSAINSDNNIFTFMEYYPDDYYEIMLHHRCPYVRINNEMFWNVPYCDVKIVDFLKTHCLTVSKEIVVEVDNVGGFGDIELELLEQGWSYIWFAISNGMTLFSFVKFIVEMFGGKKAKTPTARELAAFVYEKDSWNEKELSEELMITEQFAKDVLNHLGYDLHNGRYWKNAWKKHTFERKIEEIDYINYIREYINKDLSILENVDTEMNERISAQLLYIFEISNSIGIPEKYDEVISKIDEIKVKKGKDSWDSFEEICELLSKEISVMEEKGNIY